MRMVIFVFLLSTMVLSSCRDNEKTPEEKIVGTWVGYQSSLGQMQNTDTFVFNGNDLIHYYGARQRLYEEYSLSGNVVRYKNGESIDSIYDYLFVEDTQLILDPGPHQFTTGLDPKFYLHKMK